MNDTYDKLKPFIGKTNLVSNLGYGQLIQNAEERDLYFVPRESSLTFFLKKLKQNNVFDFHLFIWQPELKNYSTLTLEKDLQFVSKANDILIYRSRDNKHKN